MKYIFQIIFLVTIGFSQLEVSVYTDKEEYSYSEPIEIFVSGSNITGDTLFLEWSSAQQWDYAIDGEWHLDGAAIFSFLTILPDSTHIWHWTNNYLIDPGDHEIVGQVLNYGISHDTTYITVNTLRVIPVLENPSKYSLLNSYPNPFNPITTIQYGLPRRSDVQITIYDLLGRKVTTLVAEIQEAGYKSVMWNATNDNGQQVSTGVYLYRIRADGFVETRKMVLLR